MSQTKAQLVDFATAAPDKISEGNSKVEVVESGTGYVVAEADGSEKFRVLPAGVKLSGSTESNIVTQAATGGGTTTIDFNTADNFIITMGGNTAISDSNSKAGQSGTIWLVQDGTGSRTASWAATFKWVGGTAPTLSTTAAAIDRVDYICKAGAEINSVVSLDVK